MVLIIIVKSFIDEINIQKSDSDDACNSVLKVISYGWIFVDELFCNMYKLV